MSFVLVTLLTVILSISAEFRLPTEACYPRDEGIASITPQTGITGRYELEICNLLSNHLVEDGAFFVRLEYAGENDEENCNSVWQENILHHSFFERNLFDLNKCPVTCQTMNFDLLANGCYDITYIIVDSDFHLLSKGHSIEYINDSKSVQSFHTEPTISIIYDPSEYLDITWTSGGIPITSYTLRVCTSNKNNTNTNQTIFYLKNCSEINDCEHVTDYIIRCETTTPNKLFEAEGTRIIVFDHQNVHWGPGMFKQLTTAIYTLDENDRRGPYIRHGKASYLTTVLIDTITNEEISTEFESPSVLETTIAPKLSSSRTTKTAIEEQATTKNLQDHEKVVKFHGAPETSGAWALIITCVVLGFILIMVLLGGTLYMRGHIRYFYFR